MPLATQSAEAEAVTSTPTAGPKPSHRRGHCPRPATHTSGPERQSELPSGDTSSTDYADFAEELLDDLAPNSLLERVLAERVMLAAWRLHLISVAEIKTATQGSSRKTRNGHNLPPMTREVLRAESSLETALTMLEAARAPRRPWGHAASTGSKSHLDPSLSESEGPNTFLEEFLPGFSNEWTQLPDRLESPPSRFDFNLDGNDGHENDQDEVATRLWSDRLSFDENVSEESPVVKGTWVTVGHVVSLIVDGWTWSDILRAHPELSEDDVRACLSYTVEQDGRGGN